VGKLLIFTIALVNIKYGVQRAFKCIGVITSGYRILMELLKGP
jgi:hypothetical protein